MKRPKWKEGVDRGCEERCALKEQKRASAALFALERATLFQDVATARRDVALVEQAMEQALGGGAPQNAAQNKPHKAQKKPRGAPKNSRTKPRRSK